MSYPARVERLVNMDIYICMHLQNVSTRIRHELLKKQSSVITFVVTPISSLCFVLRSFSLSSKDTLSLSCRHLCYCSYTLLSSPVILSSSLMERSTTTRPHFHLYILLSLFSDFSLHHPLQPTGNQWTRWKIQPLLSNVSQ